MEKENIEVKNRRIEELGVYYLYFLCSFLDKMAEKIKGVNIVSRNKIYFREALTEEFKKKCENIYIYNLEMVNELSIYEEININFCERFVSMVNSMCFNKIDCDMIRKHIFQDIRYISFNCFGAVLSFVNINIEDIIEFFDDIIEKIKNNKATDSLFVVADINPKDTKINTEYLDIEAKIQDNQEEKTYYDYYIEAKEALSNKLFDYNNRIGFRLENNIIKPYIKELCTMQYTQLNKLNSLADSFLNYYMNVIQNEYYLNYSNGILSLKTSNAVKKYLNDSKTSRFVSLSDMEALIENE